MAGNGWLSWGGDGVGIAGRAGYLILMMLESVGHKYLLRLLPHIVPLMFGRQV
jgi:hypothetical protein